MRRSALIVLIISLPLLLNSCSNELDFSESWIRLYTHQDYGHNNRQDVPGDTIYTSFTTTDKPLILQIRTQSNNGSSPKFFKTIDNGRKIEITNEVPTGGFYAHDNDATRHVRDIDVMIPSHLFFKGQIIRYETRLGSHSGTLTKTVHVVIE